MKRSFLILAFTLLLALSCGRKPSDKITISWWQFWTDPDVRPVIQEIVRNFEQDHPNVAVELVDLTWADGHDKIAVAFSTNAAPDLVELGSDWVPEFASAGVLLNIASAVDTLLSNYLMWEPGEANNGVYAMPWFLGTRVLFVNRQLVTQAGFNPNDTIKDWPELLEVSAAVNDLGSDIYGFGSNAAERHRLYKKFLPFLWANGGRILSPDGSRCLLSDPAAVTALKYYVSLCETGLTDTQRRLEDAFLEGQLGFVISGDWLLKRIAKENPEFDFGTQVIPGPTGLAQSSSFVGGEYLAVSAHTEYPEIAIELAKFICLPENQLRFCLTNHTATPSSVAAAHDSSLLAQPHFSTFVKQLASGRMPPVHPQWVYIEDRLEKAIEAALLKEKKPQAACEEACDQIGTLLTR
jgi:multiple sugar transport system substrate-binding protein